MKELRALHEVSRLMLDDALSLREQHQRVVDLLPPAMQFPDVTTACIRYETEPVATLDHAPTPWILSARFTTAAGREGVLEVAYREARPDAALGPFLAEEQSLLSSIADMLRTSIDRRDARESLERTNERLGLALAAAGMGVWEWDLSTDLVTWCEHLASMAGIQSTTSPFGTHSELVHPDDRDYVLSRLERAGQGHDDLGDLSFRTRRPDGGWRYMIARALISRVLGKVTRILAALIDVSEKRILEEGLRQAQKLEALGQVAGGVAHDFNNILAILLCNLEALRADMPPDHPWREIADELYATSERGKALTVQLLSFSRTATFKPVAIELAPLIRRLEPLLVRLAQRSIKLTIDLDPQPLAIWADPAQVEQVLMNLVGNARDAMPNGGTITVRTSVVARPPRSADTFAFSAEAEPVDPTVATTPYVAIEVQDNGTGIPDDIKARIFEPFFTSKEPGKGTGLGLAVVTSVARQWQGRIEVDSVPNKGATFRVMFPRYSQ
jgi:signal transduction histidine kinase